MTALDRTIALRRALGAAEDRVAAAGHALAELEERLEDEPGVAAEVVLAEARLVQAERRLAQLRARRDQLEELGR